MTAVQQLMQDLEKNHPELFNIYSEKGRQFVNHYIKYIEMEKQQIIDAAIWMPDHFNSEFLPELGKQYYNDRYKHKIYDEHKQSDYLTKAAEKL